jgi:hypothetical protein
MGQVREMGSQFTSNPGKRWMDPVTARRVPSKWRGTNKGCKGNKGSKGNSYVHTIYSRCAITGPVCRALFLHSCDCQRPGVDFSA